MSFTQWLQSQPWYAQVKSVMDANGIPLYLWAAVIRDESGQTGPSDVGYEKDGSVSIGLFQLNSNGVGAGQTQGALMDPVTNATLAANVMKGALSKLPDNATPIEQLRALETAAWPGNDATLIAKEEPTRIAALYATLKELGLNTLAASVRAVVAVGLTAGPPAGATQPGQDGETGPSWWPTLPLFVHGIERSAMIYGAAAALFAGGIALMSRGGSDS